MTDTATIEALLERCAEAAWQAESRRAGGRDRLIPWAEECPKTQETWRDTVQPVILISLEECAAICEAQKQEFLSEQYAVGQPISSIRERFACTQIEEAIRAKLDALPAQSKRNRDDC